MVAVVKVNRRAFKRADREIEKRKEEKGEKRIRISKEYKEKKEKMPNAVILTQRR